MHVSAIYQSELSSGANKQQIRKLLILSLLRKLKTLVSSSSSLLGPQHFKRRQHEELGNLKKFQKKSYHKNPTITCFWENFERPRKSFVIFSHSQITHLNSHLTRGSRVENSFLEASTWELVLEFSDAPSSEEGSIWGGFGRNLEPVFETLKETPIIMNR